MMISKTDLNWHLI